MAVGPNCSVVAGTAAARAAAHGAFVREGYIHAMESFIEVVFVDPP